MQNSLIDFNNDYEKDAVSYTATNTNHVMLTDTNNSTYNNGWINFSAQSIAGSENSMMFDFAQGYVEIPWLLTLTLKDGESSFGTRVDTVGAKAAHYRHSPENTFAAGSKGSHHITDVLQIEFGGASVNRNSNYNNLVINQKLKMWSNEQQTLLGDIMNTAVDSAESYKVDAKIGETNYSLLSSINCQGGVGGSNFRNEGYYKRAYSSNNDTVNNPDSLFSIKSAYSRFTTNAMENAYNQGLVAMFSGIIPVTTNESATQITKLVYQYVSIISL
jgi:hypothetical protein